MHGGIVSSGGWVELLETEFEKTFSTERTVTNLNILWTSDTWTHSLVTIYLNDDSSIIIPAFTDIPYSGLGFAFNFEIKDMLVSKFKIVFDEENTRRNVSYYGYY